MCSHFAHLVHCFKELNEKVLRQMQPTKLFCHCIFKKISTKNIEIPVQINSVYDFHNLMEVIYSF